MFQYYIVFFLLVVEFIFLICLLAPLPSFVIERVLSLLTKLKGFVYFTAVALLFFTVDQTLEMRKEEERQTQLPSTVTMDKESFYLTRKFRAERNFYLCAFTFTLLMVVLRLQHIIRHTKEIEAQLIEAKKK